MKENKSYELEFSTNEILQNMYNNTYNNFRAYNSSSINKNYLNLRKQIFDIMQKITMKFGFKSQTFFLTTYYLDILFIKQKKININLYKLGLACLCLSAKFCENDPIVPQLQYFVKAYNVITGYKNFISMTELMHTEVVVCKILKYKLNYFTTYDFIAFFFCHGIFKFEQIKEIQNAIYDNNKVKDDSNKEEFELDKHFVKNILGKIYRTVRNYLDIVVKIDKICLKYNSLYIAIYLIEKSMKECLANEYKKTRGNLNEEEFNKKLSNFNKRNYIYYQEIMNEFYKIHFEDNEQYKLLITDDEINSIFKDENKKNKKLSNDNDSKNKLLFSNTLTNGFYKKLKLPSIKNNDNDENTDINNEKNEIISNNFKNKDDINNNNSTKKKFENLEEEDDLNSNLNINELKKEMNSKKIKISGNKKYHKISTNSLDISGNNHIFEFKSEKVKHTQSKIKNLRNSNVKLKINSSTSFKTLENTNKPYSKKLVSGNNRNIIKNFNQTLKASTSTNFYPNKLKIIKTDENNIESNKTSCYLKINNNKNNNKNKEMQKIINTAMTKKYKKIMQNNDLSSKSLRTKKIFNDKFDNKSFSITGENFYPSKSNYNKIFVNKIKEPINSVNKNINFNKELRTKKISSNFYNNNSNANNSLRDLNKTVGKNNVGENRDKLKISINNENSEIKSDKSYKYKKIIYSKINNDYIQVKNNKKNELKKIILQKNTKDNSIKEGYSYKTLSNINNISAKKQQYKTIGKESNTKSTNNNNTNDQSTFSSFYKIIQKTKKLFNKEKEVVDNKKEDDKKISIYKKEEQSKSFYLSKKNFYKKNKKINDNKEKEKKNANTIIINNNINISIENKKDLKIPELNINNTIVTSEQNNIDLGNKFNIQNKRNNDEKLDDNSSKKSITIKNIFQKFNFNKK